VRSNGYYFSEIGPKVAKIAVHCIVDYILKHSGSSSFHLYETFEDEVLSSTENLAEGKASGLPED